MSFSGATLDWEVKPGPSVWMTCSCPWCFKPSGSKGSSHQSFQGKIRGPQNQLVPCLIHVATVVPTTIIIISIQDQHHDVEDRILRLRSFQVSDRLLSHLFLHMQSVSTHRSRYIYLPACIGVDSWQSNSQLVRGISASPKNNNRGRANQAADSCGLVVIGAHWQASVQEISTDSDHRRDPLQMQQEIIEK
jgi:hypothetical protein